MSSSPPNPKTIRPRAPAKSTPFSSHAAGQSTRSHLQRSAMTTSLRKAKRGQALAKKRHIKLQKLSSSSYPTTEATTTAMSSQQCNPYSKDAMHVKETIQLATSIVNLCSETERGRVPSFSMQDHASTVLPSELERMCVLLTPNDSDDMDDMNVAATRSPPMGASYDSSMAGMAANSLLSQFVGEVKTQQQHTQTNLAFLLADALAHILMALINYGSTSTCYYGQSTRIKAAIILNQLAATEPPPPIESSFDQQQFSPYGHPQNIAPASIPTSWCYVLVHSQALSALVGQLPSPTAAANPTDLCGKCVWAIGNLAGDSEMARDALHRMEALPRLIGCLSLGLSAGHGNNITQSLIDLIRNVVWALSNLFREGGIQVWDFLEMDHPHIPFAETKIPRLTERDVSMLLSCPEAFSPTKTIGNGNGTDFGKTTTWNDVATETCWLVSFLTRDPPTVDYLCQDRGDQKSKFISMLVLRLAHATRAAIGQLNNTNNTEMLEIGGLIPCCRTLKNIAIASNGRYAHSILLADIYSESAPGASSNVDAGVAHPAEQYLAKLISLGTLGAGHDASAIASEAAATAGVCLYDAGFPLPHPATGACRTLLPLLCQALVCPLSTFELRREVVWAIWNAVNFPSELYESQGANNVDVNAVRDELVAKIVWTSPDDMARALTAMLSTFNTDALEASLSLINLILHWGNGEYRGKKNSTIFEEAGLVDALWRICDNDSEESANAEQAASILDEFYEEEEEAVDDEFLQPASMSGQFHFQAPQMNTPQGGFNFGDAQHAQPMGRGRGRGRVLPAWCNQNPP